MPESIKNLPASIDFEDGFLRLPINGDPNRVLVWNPNDLNFIDRFYQAGPIIGELEEEFTALIQNFPNKEQDVLVTGDGEIKAADAILSNVDVQNAIKRMREIGEAVNEQIDYLYGPGTSKNAFMGMNPFSPVRTKTGEQQYLCVGFFDATTRVVESTFEESRKRQSKYVRQKKK